MAPFGLYLHIPFCRGGKCPYCDFYSLPFDEDLANDYTSALCRAMELQPFPLPRADTLYLGGGTPSLLGAKRLDRLLQAAAKAFSLDAGAEITLEANPESVSRELLQDLGGMGFTRVSFGVQSGLDADLQALGRPHTARQAREAILWAHGAGFAHISADLMLATPGQTLASLGESVSLLAALPVDHLSAYLLKIEAGTPFARRGEDLSLPGEDLEADLYLACNTLLEQAGFARYEISNFAKPGGQSRHNLGYWRCGEYLGLGPAAHSMILADSHPATAEEPGPDSHGAPGARYFFPRDLAAFLAADNPFSLLEADGPGGTAQEQLMLRLRLAEGFDAQMLVPLGLDPAPVLARAKQLAAHGLCTVQDDVLRLTTQGCLLSNSVISSLLAALP